MTKKTKLSIELPPEFVELRQDDGVAPETVLNGFIADLCGIRVGYPYLNKHWR